MMINFKKAHGVLFMELSEALSGLDSRDDVLKPVMFVSLERERWLDGSDVLGTSSGWTAICPRGRQQPG
jgi:hypothetical protein